MDKEMSQAELLKEKLFSQKKNAYLVMDDKEIDEVYDFCEGYKDFLTKAKIEREFVTETIARARKMGFSEFDKNRSYAPGDKFYVLNRGKAVILAVMGSRPLDDGIRLTAAHIDSPRLDLKQHPLYEDREIAFFKTHYYGGIKKYQWSTVPMSLHGVVIRADGSSVEVNIGEDEGDPQFCVCDLLIHLADEQMKRPANKIITGEELNILVGSRPFKDDKASELVKLNILSILNEKYNINEDDFISAELEAVPAYKAVDVGFDRSLIGGYGQDDKVCAYTQLEAILETENPAYTCVAVFADKEEIGSMGNTGLESSYLKYFIMRLAEAHGYSGIDVISATQALSADVNAAFDPTFPEPIEYRNGAKLNYGVAVTKYTGARGKSGTSDASAEFMGKVRKLFNESNVQWQTGELGKVDAGGGGTVAMYLANLDIDVIDVGVPVLSMHSPFEVTSKIDTFMAYKAFKCFFAER